MAAPILAASSHGPGHDHEDKGVCFDRITKVGRHLWYVLKVIQQPERARACGSGPKSSADRRPVDPPPVVELRIYEGPTFEQAQNKDITFLYNANFFLYATLEHARVMAHGRVQSPAVNTPPVLTGVPVSGMAYLDRPKEAGYFLFPDLSVRHEGRYRFNFNLYEETKEDKDRSDTGNSSAEAANPAIGGSFDWIMEVKTQDFLVYSAKKFPGLTESTALSRVVAEQGCRVRIRRDVRMRRRPGKDGNDNYDNAEEQYNRRRRTATPEAQREAYRARSMSGSVERAPYSAEAQRRGSGVEYPPLPPSHYHLPQTPTSAVPGHLNFLGGNSSQSFAPPPTGPASSVPTSPAFAPPVHGGSYGYQHVSHQPQQPAPPPYYQERRLSQSYAPPPPPSHPSKLEVENGRQEPIKLPSFSDLKSRLSDDFPRAPIVPTTQYSQPSYSPTSSGPSRSQSYASVGTNSLLPPPPGMFSRSDASTRAGQKRAHGDVFGATDYDLGPRRNGTRESGETDDPDGAALMVYARATGDHAVSQAYV